MLWHLQEQSTYKNKKQEEFYTFLYTAFLEQSEK